MRRLCRAYAAAPPGAAAAAAPAAKAQPKGIKPKMRLLSKANRKFFAIFTFAGENPRLCPGLRGINKSAAGEKQTLRQNILLGTAQLSCQRRRRRA